MYLLMLLATFLSAIYGYNLSVRQDYDRDVPRKKAMAVVYKFLYQHNTMNALINSKTPGADWCQPGDMLYGTDDFIAGYKSGSSDVVDFPLRRIDRNGDSLGETARDIMQTGRSLYPSTQMVTKVLCLDDELHEATEECTSTEDPSGTGGVIDSCCERGIKFLVSYSKLDARWRNRMTGTVSSDFLWALTMEDFKTNIGVITWQSGSNAGWHFQGRTRIEAAYYEDKQEYIQDKLDQDDSLYADSIEYPAALQLRTSWDLPPIFTENYFKDANNSEMCKESGCLFRIQQL